MSNQINIHLPPGITNLNELSLTDFISQTKTDGGVKTTDLYYHPTAPKTLKEKFLQHLSAFSARISAHWKPAMSSANVEKALANIHQKPYLTSKAEVANVFNATIIMAAESGGELHANGATISLINADQGVLLEHMLNKV